MNICMELSFRDCPLKDLKHLIIVIYLVDHALAFLLSLHSVLDQSTSGIRENTFLVNLTTTKRGH